MLHAVYIIRGNIYSIYRGKHIASLLAGIGKHIRSLWFGKVMSL
jgi:hypothetical protein